MVGPTLGPTGPTLPSSMPDRCPFLLHVHTVQGIAAAVHALIEPGDEAVLLEPAYDSYAPSVGVRASMRCLNLNLLHKFSSVKSPAARRVSLSILLHHEADGRGYLSLCAAKERGQGWGLVHRVCEWQVLHELASPTRALASHCSDYNGWSTVLTIKTDCERVACTCIRMQTSFPWTWTSFGLLWGRRPEC
jgi:hypothetical protein